MFYEQRTYQLTNAPMMEHLHKRMETQLIPLWEEFDVSVAGAWEVTVGPNLPRYTYLIPWRSLAHREESFAAFYADPRWSEIRARSVAEAGDQIVASLASEIWTPASYSKMQ